ncbi:MAG TPA: type II 3-dehydroquinate dehydratase [Chitinophagales bacterium]|nr:type II 3-dehydroquinate dehydratase [Chitinophagales bacterium]HNI54663.1 type II 3-dehydroquinate dehydratase [Chitinophagales bacterium]HNK96540.1 type II 3-dehydroquinate dehydratase [Chitinophagales bacterium]HNM07929.1 type II 3-dehydroquinate dehydratase [Chitinophagales bacterium]HNO29309.1 type II 3-dehydroquinate dehydratase [Chitinophagales bacterium]
MRILILNGPNLNLLGVREPEIYGTESFETFFAKLQQRFPNVELITMQSNHEGALIDALHAYGFSYDGIIINAGGLSHTSIALADAISAITTPVVEVHISNTFARESFRHHDVLTTNCKGIIAGLGLEGYALAVKYFLSH